MKYFSISELCHSDTARRHNISNTPSLQVCRNLTLLTDNLLDPLREQFGQPVIVTSGYRCQKLNSLVGGSSTSQHMTGQAADITARNKQDNRRLFDLLKQMDFDQLIWEQGNKNFPDWIHVSYKTTSNRHEILNLY